MVKAFSGDRRGNRLLDLLPADDYKRLQPLLQKVGLAAQQVLYEARSPIEQVYFPLTAVLSAVTVMHDGHAIEVATVGNEGVSGLPALAVVTTSPHRVFVQIQGEALRVDAATFHRECKRLDKLSETMNGYLQAFLFQISQCVACNGLHKVEQRCCRWLLMTHDRVDGDELNLTHEFLSYMLGVRRTGVTEVLQRIQKQGCIRTRQGKITVLDRPGLEALVCECYQSIQDEYRRLLN